MRFDPALRAAAFAETAWGLGDGVWGLASRVEGRRSGSVNVQRFRGGLVFKAHRLLYHSTRMRESNKEEEEVRGLGPTNTPVC